MPLSLPCLLRLAHPLTHSHTHSQDGKTGTASIAVPLNLPPACPVAAGCLSLDSASGVFPTATFTATASGWASPAGDALNYEFGVARGNSQHAQAVGVSTSYAFTGLNPGAHAVYVCAVRAGPVLVCAVVLAHGTRSEWAAKIPALGLTLATAALQAATPALALSSRDTAVFS